MGREDPSARVRGRLGRVLKNKWRLERLLAVGGMGAVYEAVHRNGKRVAIKMLHPELCRDELQRKRFLREGYAANAIGDPRVVTVDDDDTDEDGSAFLVMELLDGESLDRAVKRSEAPLSAADVLGYIEQLLGVLEVAHAKGVVHRDIKPENLFVTTSGTLKVLDFGIARLREQTAPATSDTSQMTIMGTPAYMPPEQAKGRWDRVDGRSDLWSVGATMFRLLSGHHVHEAETRSEQLGMAMITPARSLATVTEALDPRLVLVVDRALAYEMKDRWQSAAEMRRALQPLLAAPSEALDLRFAAAAVESKTVEPTSAVLSSVESTLSMKQRRLAAAPGDESPKRRWPAALLMLALLGLASVAIYSGRSREVPAPRDPPLVATAAPTASLPVSATATAVEAPSDPIQPAPASAPNALPSASTQVATRAGSRRPESAPRGSMAKPPSPMAPTVSAAPPIAPSASPSPVQQRDPLDRRR